MSRREWVPPVELSSRESRILKRCKSRKIFIFLREHRHALLTSEFRARLWAMYSESERGKARVDPALLAMATLLQAAVGVADREAVELTLDSQRWRMVLDHWDEETPAFSQGTLFNFRERLIAHDMDRELLERTVALVREVGGFSVAKLRVAFDASPLRGAGRVEDTFNLIGRAARRVVESAADHSGEPVDVVIERSGIPLLGHSSMKAALDRDWGDRNARSEAISELLEQVRSLETWLQSELAEEMKRNPLKERWEMLESLIEQDTEPDPDGPGHRIKRGTARDRQVSVGDPAMRHGRKTKTSRFDGFKRHIASDLDTGAICAVTVTPGNAPEREGAEALLTDVERGGPVVQLFTDRGYLGAEAVEERRAEGMEHVCKPFPLRNRGRFTKQDFVLNLRSETVTCPNGVTRPLRLGKPTRFPASSCDSCPKRAQCTTAATGRGRSLNIHAQEGFLIQLRERVSTPEGRRSLRQRVPVEHALASVERSQTKRARYKGLRKNVFDVRRHAAVHNLHVAERILRAA